ncbi:MAG: hypothetical protein AB1540_15560, partial [Bdellovibrionota bacterium]
FKEGVVLPLLLFFKISVFKKEMNFVKRFAVPLVATTFVVIGITPLPGLSRLAHAQARLNNVNSAQNIPTLLPSAQQTPAFEIEKECYGSEDQNLGAITQGNAHHDKLKKFHVKCASHQRMLQEGSNIETVNYLQFQKMFAIVESVKKNEPYQSPDQSKPPKTYSFADLQTEKICLSSDQQIEDCYKRMKKLKLDLLLQTRTRVEGYNRSRLELMDEANDLQAGEVTNVQLGEKKTSVLSDFAKARDNDQALRRLMGVGTISFKKGDAKLGDAVLDPKTVNLQEMGDQDLEKLNPGLAKRLEKKSLEVSSEKEKKALREELERYANNPAFREQIEKYRQELENAQKNQANKPPTTPNLKSSVGVDAMNDTIYTLEEEAKKQRNPAGKPRTLSDIDSADLRIKADPANPSGSVVLDAQIENMINPPNPVDSIRNDIGL